MLNELKLEIESINNFSDMNKIKIRIKIINLMVKNLIEENEKNKKNIDNILINSNLDAIKNEKIADNKINKIKGEFYLDDHMNLHEINREIRIFKIIEDEEVDLYVNNEKMNILYHI